jgi:uncharacterized protein YvpB
VARSFVVLAAVGWLALVACGSAVAATPTPSPVASPLPVASPTPTTRVLAVPWHHQAHALSCEAAALKMALEYLGINKDELTLITAMGRDSRLPVRDAKGRILRWGDPNRAYVGNPDGKIGVTGYGVYYVPVARAAAAEGAYVLAAGSGLYGRGVAPAAVYQAVLDGHPVVAWISNRYVKAPLAAYSSFGGAKVDYTLTEHAVTVVGVRPDAVLINDPWFGRAWHSKAQFESAYATFADMAVILSR